MQKIECLRVNIQQCHFRYWFAMGSRVLSQNFTRFEEIFHKKIMF